MRPNQPRELNENLGQKCKKKKKKSKKAEAQIVAECFPACEALYLTPNIIHAHALERDDSEDVILSDLLLPLVNMNGHVGASFECIPFFSPSH